MTQPKRTASRLLSALLGLIMLLSLLPTVTLAAERVPEELKAMKVTSDIEEIAQFRHPVETPTFEETTGKPVKFKTDPEWWRYNETTGKYERYTGKTFKEGKYKFFIVATITGSDYDQYQFASQVAVTVNGEKWTTTGSAIDPGRKLSRILMQSPEYTIEGRQLVNRVVLTSNVEEILAQKDRLDDPSIRVRSAFTTTGTKVSCVDTDVSAYDWQISGQSDETDGYWAAAFDPDGYRPWVRRGMYYRLVFTVNIKYADRDTYALVEPDQLTVTLDGEKCRIVGDVEGKHGEEIKVCTRAYYAPPLDELKSITNIDLKTSIPNILQAYNYIENPSIRETKDKMVFRADSYEDGWQHGVARVLPGHIFQYTWSEPTTSYFKKDNVYRYGAVLTVKDWEHWKLGVANTLTVTVDGERIPSENIERLDDFHVLVYSEKHQARERTPIEEVNVTSNMASIVKLGGTVQTPTITFNDGDQDLYIDGSIGFGWLKWEDSDWYTYEKGEFEPGKYCYYTNVHVRNWDEYAFSDNVTVNWDGKPCDRPTGRAPSQIFVSSPVYIVNELPTITSVTITSNIKDILKVGGEVKKPTITTKEASYVYTQPVWTYEWERKIGPGNSDADWEIYQKSTFEAGTYRYNIYVKIRNPEEFKLAGKDELTVKWDGAVCSTFQNSDMAAWVESGEYTISGRPANVTLGSAKAVSGGITVTWQAADGAAKYNVYRKDATNTKWKVIATVSGTSYTDKTAKAGTKYTYTVRGVAADGKTLSPGFDRTGISATMPTASTTPANVTLGSAKAVNGGIQVTWQAANGAAKYNVYRKDAVNTKWTVIATVAGTSYTDKSGTAGTKYTYTVRGVAADGKTLSPGYDKTGVSATITKPTPTPTTPANVTLGSAKAVNGGIQVTWQAANGAAKYKVYRKDAVNTKWTVIATVAGTSYTDKSGTAGTKYSYTVRGVAADGKTLSPSYNKTGVSAVIAPAKVVLVSAKADSAGILVTWQKANGAHAYQVYRKDAVNTKWTVIAKNVRDTEWKDITAVKGTKYTYTVRAVADDGVTLGGYDSAGKSAMVTASPTTPANVTLGTATAGKNGIVVTWSYAADARTYRVYRKAPGDTKWVAVANVNGKSWTDKNVTSGVKYSYTVRGVNANGVLSPGYNKTGVSAVAK